MCATLVYIMFHLTVIFLKVGSVLLIFVFWSQAQDLGYQRCSINIWQMIE